MGGIVRAGEIPRCSKYQPIIAKSRARLCLGRRQPAPQSGRLISLGGKREVSKSALNLTFTLTHTKPLEHSHLASRVREGERWVSAG